MKFFKSIGLLSLASAVMAFESTVPCVMWSPKNYVDSSVKTNSQFVISQTDATSTIYSSLSSDICSAKVIALINQPQVHSNDFVRFSEAFTELKEQSSAANTRAQFEYIASGVDVQQIAKMIATQCDSAISILDPSTISSEELNQQNTPIVAIVPLPKSNDDVEVLKANDQVLGKVIESIENNVQDDYVVIYTSSEPKVHQTLKRRAPVETKDLPIFEKYQLFTPGVFMVIGVVALLLFIAGTGITWLVAIQTPVRFEGKQKKN